MVLSIKPIGSACNMTCAYCYYLGKNLAADKAPRQMSAETLEAAIRSYARAMSPDAELNFLWHGGEPMLMPLSFYRHAIELQQKYAAGRKVNNSLQTNGTLIDSQWADFFAAGNWLLGVSVDGPRQLHDRYRRFKNGNGTHNDLLANIALLNRAGVQWNAMATVNHANVGHPDEFYDFFRNIGTPYLQFSPIVERRKPDGTLARVDEPGELTPESITPREWGDFLCAVFDRWVKTDVGRIFVQIFDATLAGKLGATPGVCIFATECFHSPIVETDGDVYCCDHFVFDRYRLGNIRDTDLATLMSSQSMAGFGHMKRDTLPADCRDCRYLTLCNGECPRNRFDRGANYLCRGYKQYFSHADNFIEHARRQVLARIGAIQQ